MGDRNLTATEEDELLAEFGIGDLEDDSDTIFSKADIGRSDLVSIIQLKGNFHGKADKARANAKLRARRAKVDNISGWLISDRTYQRKFREARSGYREELACYHHLNLGFTGDLKPSQIKKLVISNYQYHALEDDIRNTKGVNIEKRRALLIKELESLVGDYNQILEDSCENKEGLLGFRIKYELRLKRLKEKYGDDSKTQIQQLKKAWKHYQGKLWERIGRKTEKIKEAKKAFKEANKEAFTRYDEDIKTLDNQEGIALKDAARDSFDSNVEEMKLLIRSENIVNGMLGKDNPKYHIALAAVLALQGSYSKVLEYKDEKLDALYETRGAERMTISLLEAIPEGSIASFTGLRGNAVRDMKLHDTAEYFTDHAIFDPKELLPFVDYVAIKLIEARVLSAKIDPETNEVYVAINNTCLPKELHHKIDVGVKMRTISGKLYT